uniref:Uncharacterized protein n=2 Tax=Lygus hesperus TaxID=30085 RepID=A0A0A9Z7Z5_LYGHE
MSVYQSRPNSNNSNNNRVRSSSRREKMILSLPNHVYRIIILINIYQRNSGVNSRCNSDNKKKKNVKDVANSHATVMVMSRRINITMCSIHATHQPSTHDVCTKKRQSDTKNITFTNHLHCSR